MKKNANQEWRKKIKIKKTIFKRTESVTSETMTCCTCITDWRMWQFLRRGLSIWLQQALCQPNLWQIHWKLCSWMWGGLSWKQMWPRCAFFCFFFKFDNLVFLLVSLTFIARTPFYFEYFILIMQIYRTFSKIQWQNIGMANLTHIM